MYGDAGIELAPIRVDPLPSWRAIWRAQKSFQWMCAGYGSSKTTFGVWEAFLNATVRHPGYVGVVAAPTFPLLMQSWFKEWKLWFEPYTGLWTLHRDPKTGYEIRFTNGSTILLRSTSDETSNEGINAAWLVYDEASREGAHGPWRVLAARVRRGYPGRLRTRLILGPPNARSHWTAKEFGYGPGPVVNAKGRTVVFEGDAFSWSNENHVLVRARTRDNPHLPEGYEHELRSQPGSTQQWCDQYLDAIFGSIEGAVWPQFDRMRHIVRADSLVGRIWRRVVVGTDWGWTHPGAMIAIATDGRDAYALDEEVHAGKLVDANPKGWGVVGRDLAKRTRASEFHCDPSAPREMTALADAFAKLRHGARVYPADNAMGEGVRRVGARFEAVGEDGKRARGALHGGLWISDKCVQLIDKIEGYGRRKVRGVLQEAPQEHDDDPCDGLRYGVMALGAA